MARSSRGPLRLHGLAAGAAAARERVRELLDLVGLPPHGLRSAFRTNFPAANANASQSPARLRSSPDFIVGDEPISALDVNIQAQIINLMIGLQERLGLTYLFIAHDLAVVRHISDRIVVLYLGRVVETAPARGLFARPLHPYTNSLISAVPVPDPHLERSRRRIALQGEVPSAVDPPSGCHFRTRCPAAATRCAEETPRLTEADIRAFRGVSFPGVCYDPVTKHGSLPSIPRRPDPPSPSSAFRREIGPDYRRTAAQRSYRASDARRRYGAGTRIPSVPQNGCSAGSGS